MATLPNKESSNGFLLLALDRQYAFMLAELTAIREMMLGSDALIAKVKASPSTTLDSILAILQLPESTEHFGFTFTRLCQLVNTVAYGDALLRWGGHLPPVPPFTPSEDVRPCTAWPCGCGGSLPQSTLVARLKSSPKTDWQRFFDYAEQERASGRLSAPSAATLRARLETALNKSNETFLSNFSKLLDTIAYPHYELSLVDREQRFRHLLDVEPLPADLLPGLERSSPGQYSLLQLEELRKIGKALRNSLIRRCRDEGNAYFAQAKQLRGRQADEALLKAQLTWEGIMSAGGVEALTAQSNLAALALQKQE